MENTRAERPDELLAHVARVKRAALEYGARRFLFAHGILKQIAATEIQSDLPLVSSAAHCLELASACPALHVKGAQSLVSCFDIDQCVLAVFADMSAAVLESMDTRELERQFEPILIELQGVLSALAP